MKISMFDNQHESETHWIDRMVQKGQIKPHAEFRELSVALAKAFLARNDCNRKLRQSTVERYAMDIMEDRWQFNGESIVVSDQGTLNDGQHRCHAVILAGEGIPCIFSFGASHESRLTTNQGQTKTTGDYLGMEGVSNANNIAAIAKAVIEVKRHGKFVEQRRQTSKSEVLEFAMNNAEIEDSFKAVHKTGANRIASPSVLGVCHYLFQEVNKEAADEFMEKLICGASLDRSNPIFVVREKLLSRDSRLNKNEQVKALINAWKNWRKGNQVRTLTHSVKKGEKLPEVC